MNDNMIKYIEKAHLPKKKVCLVAVSDSSLEIIYALKNMNIQVVPVTTSVNLAIGISEHSDILLHHLGGNMLIVDRDSTNLYDALSAYNFSVSKTEDKVSSPYPLDISLNCFSLNNYLYANLEYTEKRLLKHYIDNGYILVNTKQGYSKCSVLIISDNAAITANKSLYNSMRKNGVDMLLIDEGDIDLKGYNYGFIGGCGGLIDNNILAFTGDISLHKNSEKIIAFLQNHDVKYICLTEERLYDIGGIIPLMSF